MAAPAPPAPLDTLWSASVQPLIAPFLAIRESFSVDDAPMRALIEVYKALALQEQAIRAEFEKHRRSNIPFAERIIGVHNPLVTFMQRLQARIEGLRSSSKSYECVRTLEKSLFGKVKFGRHRASDEQVAIKLTDIAEFERRPHLEDPFAEIQVLRCLSRGTGHRNVVRLVDAFVEEGVQWTVLEFCSGGELFRRVEMKGPIPEAESRLLLRQILAGLQFIHNSGFAHLDMSLENVMADARGEMKIIDFGMAHQIPRSGKLPPFVDGIGKTGYRAPEIPSGEFDPVKADIYSVGVMLFMMLTGHSPYKMPDRADRRFVLAHSGQLAALLTPDAMSLQAVDLLNRILGPAEARPSIDQILRHPWMQQQ